MNIILRDRLIELNLSISFIVNLNEILSIEKVHGHFDEELLEFWNAKINDMIFI